MSTVAITVNASVSALPTGKAFGKLRLTLTDAGGAKDFDMDSAYISANAMDQGAGTFKIPASFNAIAPGNYTVSVQAYDGFGDPLGTRVTATGNMPAGLGAGFFQAVSIASVAS